MIEPKPIAFRGSALEDLRAFPLAARRDAGYQLDRIQNGHEPDDCKPMRTVGPGGERNPYPRFRRRFSHHLRCADAIYVLHCFQKKTQKTSQADRDLAVRRYRDLLKELER